MDLYCCWSILLFSKLYLGLKIILQLDWAGKNKKKLPKNNEIFADFALRIRNRFKLRKRSESERILKIAKRKRSEVKSILCEAKRSEFASLRTFSQSCEFGALIQLLFMPWLLMIFFVLVYSLRIAYFVNSNPRKIKD